MPHITTDILSAGTVIFQAISIQINDAMNSSQKSERLVHGRFNLQKGLSINLTDTFSIKDQDGKSHEITLIELSNQEKVSVRFTTVEPVDLERFEGLENI